MRKYVDPQHSGSNAYSDGLQSQDAAVYATSWALQLLRQLDPTTTPTQQQRELLHQGITADDPSSVLSEMTRLDLAARALAPLTHSESQAIAAGLRQLRSGRGYSLDRSGPKDLTATAVAVRLSATIKLPVPADVTQDLVSQAKSIRWDDSDLDTAINRLIPLTSAVMLVDAPFAQAALRPRWAKQWAVWAAEVEQSSPDGARLAALAAIRRINTAWGLTPPRVNRDAWQALRTKDGLFQFAPNQPADFQVTVEAASVGLVDDTQQVEALVKSRAFTWGWLSPTAKPSLRATVAAVLIDSLCGQPLPAFPSDALSSSQPGQDADAPYLQCVLYTVYGHRPPDAPVEDPTRCQEGNQHSGSPAEDTILKAMTAPDEASTEELLKPFCSASMRCSMRPAGTADIYATAVGVTTSTCSTRPACRSESLAAFLVDDGVRETTDGAPSTGLYVDLAAALIAGGSSEHLRPALRVIGG